MKPQPHVNASPSHDTATEWAAPAAICMILSFTSDSIRAGRERLRASPWPRRPYSPSLLGRGWYKARFDKRGAGRQYSKSLPPVQPMGINNEAKDGQNLWLLRATGSHKLFFPKSSKFTPRSTTITVVALPETWF